MSKRTFIDSKTGEKIIVDTNNPNEKLLTLEESLGSTFYNKRFDVSGLSERVFSDSEGDDYIPTQEEIEEEVEEALRGIDID